MAYSKRMHRWIAAAALTVLCVCVVAVIFKMTSRQQTVQKHMLAGGYEVLEIRGLLTPAECADLMAFAEKKGLEDSLVWSYDGQSENVVDGGHRKSRQAWLGDEEHPVAAKMAALAERLTGIPRSHQERLQVAKYDEGGKFNEHYDACNYGDEGYCDRMNHGAGQRRATLLVYLNAGFGGGETEFVMGGLKIKPEVGKGILFWNVDAADGILAMSKHRGHPVTGGEKWIATKWVHRLPYVE